MKVNIEQKENEVIVRLNGELDTVATTNMSEVLNRVADLASQNLIIDCTDLKYICSGGLRIFLGVLKSTQEKGHQVFIKGISNDVRAVFAMTGFINLFKFK